MAEAAAVALAALRRWGVLEDVDLHFAGLMGRLAGRPGGEQAGAVTLAAALASRWTGAGHVCLELAAVAGQVLNPGADAAPVKAPALRAWRRALEASPVVGRPGERRPLVLDPHDRLYLHRYWDYERALAEDLLARAADPPPAPDPARLRASLDRLFPPPATGGPDWQRVAAAVAVLGRLCVISGGPGTGKTSVVARILALLVEQSGARAPRIALAAPTGKAAGRMQEALRRACEGLDLDARVRAALPQGASTVHRLLGTRPGSAYFRHDRDDPLPVDVLVVDEASMVDLALMAKLVRALPPRARLVLLGDKDQLASVEAGAVLASLCPAAPGFTPAFRARLGALCDGALPAAPRPASALADAAVLLTRSYRFDADSGIGRLATLVRAGEAGAAAELLAAADGEALAWSPALDPPALAACIRDGFAAHRARVAAGASPAAVLAGLGEFRVLAVHRDGRRGAGALNGLAEQGLAGARGGSWYAGRPVMVGANDYELGLFNGDVGVALAAAGGEARLRVYFEGEAGRVRALAPARLPGHATVFALTVHKSQGSEFDEVLLVLPDRASPLLTRELIYTAVTRARRRVRVVGERSVLEAGIRQAVSRASGLRERLWGEA